MDGPDTPTVIDDEDPTARAVAALVAFLDRVSLFLPVDPQSEPERRLWRACELCTYLEYRFDDPPDPRSLSDEAIADWTRRGLTREERPGDPARLGDYHPYWVTIDGRILGTVALAARDPGWGQCNLWIASLYLFREERGSGYGTLITAALEGMARHLGLGAVRLDTYWLWQGAVRFYLRQGFWVANWKRGLSLVRYLDDPPYGVRCDGDRMEFILAGAPVVTARRAGDTLIWEESPLVGPDGQAPEEPRASVASTFALTLAVAGWPLIRGPAQWEHRYGWSDTGMPEGLAYKITVFEGYARHCGQRIDTPRIPGLVYPEWEEL